MARPRFLPDNTMLLLLAVVAAASLFPCTGRAAVAFDWLSTIMIGVLFFMHGAKLSRDAVISGMANWRLHVTVLLCTFLAFPLLGLLLKPVITWFVTPDLYVGILFLCVLPSTVQSSIAFTAVARGNVSAAICSASASNLLGVFLTPLLAGLIVLGHGTGHFSMDSILKIVYQLLVPFVAGQIMRPWLGTWMEKNKAWLRWVDQSSVLLVVYVAFSSAVNEGIWKQLPLTMLLSLIVINGVLLGLIMVLTIFTSRRLGFSKEDEIAILFCGSKKSMASGVPMAKVLFSSSAVGMVLLPVMLFHQFQLMVCAALAQRYARRPTIEGED